MKIWKNLEEIRKIQIWKNEVCKTASIRKKVSQQNKKFYKISQQVCYLKQSDGYILL